MCLCFPGGTAVKNLPANVGDIEDAVRPWVRKIPWRRKWQCTPVFLPGNPMDRGAWRATQKAWHHRKLDLEDRKNTSQTQSHARRFLGRMLPEVTGASSAMLGHRRSRQVCKDLRVGSSVDVWQVAQGGRLDSRNKTVQIPNSHFPWVGLR